MKENTEYTELEKVLQKTIQKQNNRITGLMLDLDLAQSQIEVMKELEAQNHKENTTEGEDANG